MGQNYLFGFSSILCLSLPIIAILYYRLYRHASLMALMVYYALQIFYCANGNKIPAVPNYENTWDVIYAYIQIPLMLIALLYFCPKRERQQGIYIVTIFFVGYAILMSAFMGFTPLTTTYIMAPGLLLVMLYSLFLFLRQVRFTYLHRKNVGRVLMLFSITSSFAFYFVVFYTYFINKQADIYSSYLLYFISSTVAALMMSTGLFMMRYRIRELQELKITRRELQLFFGY